MIHFETRKLQRCYWVHFLLATYCGTWHALKSSRFPQWDSHGEKWVFLCTQLSFGASYWVRDWGLCLLLLSGLGAYLMQIHAGPVHTVYSVGVLMCIRPVLFSWCLPFPQVLTLFLFPFPAGFLGHRRGILLRYPI